MHNTDKDIAMACKATQPSQVPFDYMLLHPETSPDAIRTNQRAVIREFLDQYGTSTLAVISREVCLPVSVVFKRLLEMGYQFPEESAHAKTCNPEWSVECFAA